jgi:dihydrofolate reductase
MPSLIYSMTMSLDGFVADPAGEIDWSAPDAELFRFHTERVQELGAMLLGRRLYESMLYWETAHENLPQRASGLAAELEVEFAQIWQALPKVVFSTTLDRVQGNARLAEHDVAREVAELKQRSGADVEVGGAGLASTCAKLDLIDEYRLFVRPVVLGGGTPYFPPLDERIALELAETRTFAGVVYLRYRRDR